VGDGNKTRREFLTIKAADADSRAIDVLISHDRLLAIARRGMGHINEAAEIVPGVLQRPTAIFEGLCADDDEDRRGAGWRCYAGTPDRSYTADGRRRPPWEDEVFLVFINHERIAYNWRWEKCDLDDPRLPQDYQSRFKRKLL
jgi:hypothetical protein